MIMTLNWELPVDAVPRRAADGYVEAVAPTMPLIGRPARPHVRVDDGFQHRRGACGECGCGVRAAERCTRSAWRWGSASRHDHPLTSPAGHRAGGCRADRFLVPPRSRRGGRTGDHDPEPGRGTPTRRRSGPRVNASSVAWSVKCDHFASMTGGRVLDRNLVTPYFSCIVWKFDLSAEHQCIVFGFRFAVTCSVDEAQIMH